MPEQSCCRVLQLPQPALLILYFFSSIYAAILRGEHFGDFVHHFLSSFVNIFASDLLALWFQHHWLTIGDCYRGAELFECVLAAPDGHRYHGHAGTEGDQTDTRV